MGERGEKTRDQWGLSDQRMGSSALGSVMLTAPLRGWGTRRSCIRDAGNGAERGTWTPNCSTYTTLTPVSVGLAVWAQAFGGSRDWCESSGS